MDMAKPKIRFKGYQEDWEQRKLSNCAGFRRGSFPQPYGNKDWYDGEGAMPFVQVADVSDDMKLVDDTKQKISKLAQPMSVCAEEGSVLVTLQGSIGRVAITQYKAFVDRTVLIFDKYNADIDKIFWAYIIKEKFIEEARKAPGGTIKTITKEVLSDFDLMLPSYDEQKMLGKLLHSLDDLITLHQRKCDETKKLKKYMLQKMFPQNGKKVPELRFSEFTDDWEQRKFSDFTWDAGKRNKDNLDLVPYAITNEHGFIPQNEAHDEFGYMKDTDRRAYNIVEPRSFAYNPARINVGSLGYYEGSENVIVSSLYEVFKTAEYVDDRFLWHWLKSPELPKWIGKLQEGSVRLYFYYDKLCECILRMPSIDEQRKIAKYLDNLDHLITLHQRKYEELQKVKKFMLQNMFV